MKSSNPKKGKVEYGSVDLPPEADDLSNHKVRITTFVDGDVLLWLRKSAAESGEKYQTFLNRLLREAMSINTTKPLEKISGKASSNPETALLKMIFGRLDVAVKKIEKREGKLKQKLEQIEKKIARPARKTSAR